MRYVTLFLCMMLFFSCKTKDKQLSKNPETSKPLDGIQRPNEVVQIDFIEPIHTRAKHPQNGVTYDALKVVSSRERATSNEETRDIESIKGDLVISDRYGEVLLEQTMEYVPNEPIKPMQDKNLEFGKAWTLYLTSASELRRLKEAVAMKNKLVATFKPTAIYFTDGSLLR